MNIDYVIVAVVSALAIALHVVLFVLFRRWMDRDLALSMAGEDQDKRAWMLAQLEHARRRRVRRKDLAAWLGEAAGRYTPG